MLVGKLKFKTRHHPAQAGFTVLELMVATTVFAIVLLVLTVGVISFSRDYFSGVNRSNTQAIARSVIDDIAHSIQFAQSDPLIVNNIGIKNTSAVCIDNTIGYYFAPGFEVSGSVSLGNHKNTYGLIKRVPATDCANPPDLTNVSSAYTFQSDNDHELLGSNMRVSELSVTPLGNHTYSIHVRIAFGDDDLFGITSSTPTPIDWTKITCQGMTGSQFCAVSDLSTTVHRRLTR